MPTACPSAGCPGLLSASTPHTDTHVSSEASIQSDMLLLSFLCERMWLASQLLRMSTAPAQQCFAQQGTITQQLLGRGPRKMPAVTPQRPPPGAASNQVQAGGDPEPSRAACKSVMRLTPGMRQLEQQPPAGAAAPPAGASDRACTGSRPRWRAQQVREGAGMLMEGAGSAGWAHVRDCLA